MSSLRERANMRNHGGNIASRAALYEYYNVADDMLSSASAYYWYDAYSVIELRHKWLFDAAAH